MDSMIPKVQQYFSAGDDQKLMSVSNQEDKDTQASNGITSQLLIKSSARSSSPESLDKGVVLRRIRYHKCKNKVRSAFQALVGSSGQPQEKWLELGDAFTCP